MRPRLVVALAVLGAASMGVAGALVAGSTTPTTPPTLTIKAVTQGVSVRWKYQTTSRQRDRQLEITRTVDGAVVATFTRDRPGLTGSLIDKVIAVAPTSYQARLLVDGDPGPWGPSVTLTPTATTTVLLPPPATTIAPPPPTTTSPTSPPGTTAPPPPTTAAPPPPTTVPPPAVVSPCPEAWDAIVIADINRERANAGVPPVVPDVKLAAGANVRGVRLATIRTLSHDGWVETIVATGYQYSALAENIHAYVGAAAVVAGWMASAGHRLNILNPIYDDVGVGCALDDRGVPWWALILGQGQ